MPRPHCKTYLRRNRTRYENFAHGSRASLPSGTLTPAQVAKAYRLPKLAAKASAPIGIVSLGGALNVSDISNAFSTWNLPAPNVISIAVDGASQSPDPSGADVENAMDAEISAAIYSYCMGGAATVYFCTAPNSDTGIADAVTALVKAGCKVISISWGAATSQWSAAARAATEKALAAAVAAGVAVCVASGDGSLDDGTNAPVTDYPAGSGYTLACGGTRLLLAADGSINSESAWGDGNPADDGGGGGFDPQTPIPAWQVGVIPAGSPGRGEPDFSSNADPASGYQIYNGGWEAVGGTSASAPFFAGFLAAIVASTGKPLGNPAAALYAARATAFNDITVGSDGAPATPGWDEATGLGSPNGPGFVAALTAGASQSPPPTKPPAPPPAPPPVTVQQVQAAVAAEFATLLRANRTKPTVVSVLRQVEPLILQAIASAFPKSREIHLPGERGARLVNPSPWHFGDSGPSRFLVAPSGNELEILESYFRDLLG